MRRSAGERGALQEQVGRALARAVELDAEIWRDPPRLEAILRDLSPDGTACHRVLGLAAQEGVVAALARLRSGGARTVERPETQKLVRRLEAAGGLTADWADWALATWCAALGLRPAPRRLQRVVPATTPTIAHQLPAVAKVNVSVGARSAPRPPRQRAPWFVAGGLAVLLGLGVYWVRPSPPPAPPASVAAVPAADWQAEFGRLATTFVGHRGVPPRQETLVLRIGAIEAEGQRGKFLYVLNRRGLRMDNAGSLSFADGTVDLPDLGTGRLGRDPNGRLSLNGEGPEGVSWQLQAMR